MAIRIKNFKKFQHFKDRSPPWVKLYRDLLDSPDWHELDPEAAKVLVMLWLIASEDEAKQGSLPEMKTLAFRLRIDQKHLEKLCNKLSQWLVHDDIEMISPRYQVDAPETETEREKETEPCSPSASESADDGFAEFWKQYPRKVGKASSLKLWKRIKPKGQLLSDLMRGLEAQKVSEQWRKDGGKFIPFPATWLNGRRWEDQLPLTQPTSCTEQPPIFVGAL
ncbi:hypothetical protein [Azonexus sp. IMCC34839]|uniref:hypothetical protein n=1 Tax=Azonexus sp. IMCC34839 TaxID=3133695 RepID=UPI00399A2231